MSNDLEKYHAKDRSVSSSSGHGQAMDAALARLRQRRNTAPEPRPQAEPPQRPAEESIFEECVCAVHDLPFLTRYVKQANGRFRIVDCVRLQEGQNSSAGAAARRAKIPVDLIDGVYPPCPWCGCDSNAHYHCSCGGVVCGGRVQGKLFRCRPSCGAEWLPGPNVKEIQGTTPQQERREWKAPPRASAWAAPAQPEKRLLLSAGSLPAKRGK